MLYKYIREHSHWSHNQNVFVKFANSLRYSLSYIYYPSLHHLLYIIDYSFYVSLSVCSTTKSGHAGLTVSSLGARKGL